jgi:hypothetical protein
MLVFLFIGLDGNIDGAMELDNFEYFHNPEEASVIIHIV